MKKSDIFWQTYLNLEEEAIKLSKYIFFTDEILINNNGNNVVQTCNSQLEVFSPHIADLLIQCCVQIEAVSKELYYDNGGKKPRGDNGIFFDEDCLKLIDIKWETHNKTVTIINPSFNFTKSENRVLTPLKKAHKRQGTYWERAYQAVKHDRYASLYKGNVKAFIHAMAALYLLNIYYRNDSWVTKYQDISKKDYSFGSNIFTVAPPIAEQLWYGNNPVRGESPFVVKYKNADYLRIEEMQKKENQAVKDYLNNQPELNEPEFQAQLLKAKDEEEKDPTKKVLPIWELAKYRLNKKIPAHLSFDEKKSLLIGSEEWKGWIYQHNNHLTADQLTPENIQNTINTVATCWGVEITKKYQKLEWLSTALNSTICEIYIG